MASSSNPRPPLHVPQVPGPKLHSFTPTAEVSNIKFLHALGHSDDKDSEVWKVEISGSIYALKMFRFNHWEYLSSTASLLASELANAQLYVDYYGPFNCECGVYGRLKQEMREDLAVKAHGYLLLTADQEADLSGTKTWGRWEDHRGQPIRAIAKEYVEETSDLYSSAAVPEQMWADLQALHSLGIVVRDIHENNYLDGKLVDFSQAYTMYHPSLDQISRSNWGRLYWRDPYQLESVVLDWIWEHRKLNAEVPKSLNRATLVAQGSENYNIDPRKYDWRKWEADVKAANAYVECDLFEERQLEAILDRL
ncbi:kinetochore Sim4 complex subunit FTA2-domain-containing protein [Podospora australis]|uniref:Kinetochore Sim4 complex subunit FTA2-domain-containing protein n=1 Tax=Podospora australis TaxID=1536484 RepID=A0AAN7AIP0_9PEZI|nr:kinetochore Sim4 complex subunit FTA2-domain-containing protein [Podospora australis]